ncbi:bifunctional folylpolyglutamate synthase/dihydrofolate synthase [Lacinutrix iliipiscaria]|uniref:Dihydrofolate synthase/folylpolyglutamate synthase n=1 Tax=Lacinutrix iliipiscaria TaxID=1230532 RepID=A0ABW5WPY1_9FLAO
MTYLDTVNWMFSQLPMYQRQGRKAYKKDLTNTILLAHHLKKPELKFKSVHVAGTNGKGSTSHMLASIFQEAGYKVGLYTSPHLKDFRERIKINGKEISKQAVIGFIKRNKAFFEANNLSFFEMTVGMAFEYFARQKVDIAIVEVGLGGRLDSTNIITPEVSVITNIGLDHTQFLGSTIQAIAEEKAGIIKQHIPVVVGETQKETTPIFNRIASEKQSNIYYADDIISEVFQSDLKGSYQVKNIKTVLQAVKTLQSLGWKVSKEHIFKGLLQVVTNTGLKGRWQLLQENPKVICDTAHNSDGLKDVMNQLQKEKFKKLHIVFGVVNDKNLDDIIKLLPVTASYYFCKPDIPRGKPVDELARYFKIKGYEGQSYDSVNEAYKQALKHADSEDLIFVGGSTFVIAEII